MELQGKEATRYRKRVPLSMGEHHLKLPHLADSITPLSY